MRIDPSQVRIFPELPLLPVVENSSLNPAKWWFERLEKYIDEISKSLPEEEALEVSYITNDGSKYRIENVGYHGPDMILLYAIDNQKIDTTICVHYTMANLVLKKIALKRGTERRIIGFVVMEKRDGKLEQA